MTQLLRFLIIVIVIAITIAIIKRKKKIRKNKFEQTKNNNMFPIPKHLKDILILVGEKSSENRVDGIVRCSCACECFHLKKDGDALVLAAVCKDCGKEYLIFDISKHGYDGFVCHDGISVPYDELKPWYCLKCGSDIYNVKLHITSLGKQDFIENTVTDGETEFSENDWVEAFDMLTIWVNCIRCQYCDVLEYETM